MADLANLRKKRGAHRSAVRNKIQSSELIIAAFSSERANDLKAIKENLIRKTEVLRELDEQILDLSLELEEEVLNNEVLTASNFAEDISKILCKIDETLQISDSDNSSASGRHTRSNSQSEQNSNSTAGGRFGRVKLPKLELPKFDGNPRAYQAWRDSFDSAIHNNESLTEVDKFNYLRSLLLSTALDSISGLSITKENYEAAIEILADRFGQKHVIISAHMDALMKIPSVSDSNDIKKLRRVYDEVETHLRSLKSLGIESDSYGCLLVPVILNHLPEEMRLILSRKFDPKGGVWELDVLLNVFKSEIEARERAGLVSAGGKIKREFNVERPTAAALLTGSADAGCVFCKGKHAPVFCKFLTEPNARRAYLRRLGRCYVCLKSGHVAKFCKTRLRSQCSCGLKHHPSLCDRRGEKQESRGADAKEASVEPSVSRTMFVNTSTSILLQTARAEVRNPSSAKHRDVRIILDTGSQRSYVTGGLCEQLKLRPVGTEYLAINTFGKANAQPQKCELVQIEIKGRQNKKSVFITACVVPMICPPPGHSPMKFVKEQYPYLRSLNLADEYDIPGRACAETIEILIGSDYYWAFMEAKVIKEQLGPVAMKSIFGWVLSGPIHLPGQDKPDGTHNMLITFLPNEQNASVERLWNLETLGIVPEEDNCDVLIKFKQSVKFKGPRYEVELPWKTNHDLLADNYELSHKRLLSLLVKLRKEPELLAEYQRVMNEQLRNGVLERVSEHVPPIGSVYYMPHHPVIRPDKETTKLRIVYDASSRMVGPALNDTLHQGPCLLPELIKVLLRFRFFKIGVIGDIEKAFLQVEIAEKDRDFLRVLWCRDINAPTSEVEVLRFTRCVFGVTSSPFHLMATLQHHLEKYRSSDPSAVMELSNCMYVDDLSSGADNPSEAFEFLVGAKRIFSEGGFNLRKFITNSVELRNSINSMWSGSDSAAAYSEMTYSNYSTGSLDSCFVGRSEQRVLGVVWNNETDNFVFDFEPILESYKEKTLTKRALLQIIARCFDPLGLVSPIVMGLKIVFQQVCRRRAEWDDLLSEEECRHLSRLFRDLEEVRYVYVSRFVLLAERSMLETVQLVAFCDASKLGYGVVIYIRSAHEKGVSVRMLVSKGRLAPIKEQSIPRLELLACLLLARLTSMVRSVLQTVARVDNEFYFSDSRTALCWIKNKTHSFKQFVENRAIEIRHKAPEPCWRHIAGEGNPADLISRGCTASELAANNNWKQGPTWLKLAPSEWPISQVELGFTAEGRDEMKAIDRKLQDVTVLITVPVSMEDCIIAKQFSSAHRLFRVTAWVLRFCNNMLSRIRVSVRPRWGEMQVEEILGSEEKWILSVQELAIKEGLLEVPTKQINFFKDEVGVIRCQSRLQNAELTYNQIMPVFLPRRSRITELIIRDAHRRLMHAGCNDTIAYIRSKYWVPKLRQLVRRIIYGCIVCRKVEGRSYQSKPLPPLPKFRVVIEEPFSTTGLDFAGPLFVRTEADRSTSTKAYVLLLTCAATRAVHLEVVPDMTSTGLVRGLRRFIGRRGSPRLILSDNAKSFKAVETKQFLRDRGISWKFNLAKAPWTGGIFERMIGLTKRCLRKVLGRALLSYEELETVLVEVESIINDRPITYIDTDSIEEPITPNHLIFGRRLLAMNQSSKESEPAKSILDLKGRVLYRQKLVRDFQRRWKSEYLLALRFPPNTSPAKRDRTIRIGDIVLVHDDGPRVLWKLARVVELIVSNDGLVRGAKVRLGCKRGGRGEYGESVTIERPLQRLYPLEMHPSRDEGLDDQRRNDEGSSVTGASDRVTQAGISGDKREDPIFKNDEFETNLNSASSRANVINRKSRRAAARDGDFMRSFLKHV